jgi:hypothetical protein
VGLHTRSLKMGPNRGLMNAEFYYYVEKFMPLNKSTSLCCVPLVRMRDLCRGYIFAIRMRLSLALSPSLDLC